jgi:hypothetical protein
MSVAALDQVTYQLVPEWQKQHWQGAAPVLSTTGGGSTRLRELNAVLLGKSETGATSSICRQTGSSAPTNSTEHLKATAGDRRSRDSRLTSRGHYLQDVDFCSSRQPM